MSTGYAELFYDQIKFFRNEGGNWRLPSGTIITYEGRQLIEKEPNVDDETLEKLKTTDWRLLNEHDQNMISTSTQKELAEHAFFEEDEIGLLHLTQCIGDDKEQSLGALIARYSMEKNVPFLLGAIYVKALMSLQQLFYFNRTPDAGCKRVRWKPKEAYVPPTAEEPPEKRYRRSKRKPLTAIPAPRRYPLYACPECGNPAKLYRCGKNAMLWHACCTDPSGKCSNFPGMEQVKTEKMAATAWNNYVKNVMKKPIWSADVQMPDGTDGWVEIGSDEYDLVAEEFQKGYTHAEDLFGEEGLDQ